MINKMIIITATTMVTHIPTISPFAVRLGSTTVAPGLLVDKTCSVDVILVDPPLYMLPAAIKKFLVTSLQL